MKLIYNTLPLVLATFAFAQDKTGVDSAMADAGQTCSADHSWNQPRSAREVYWVMEVHDFAIGENHTQVVEVTFTRTAS